MAEAKARGVDITGETCPHYLLLSSDDYARFGGIIRVNPPVREASNQGPLWDALADGTIDIIATDHAPHSPEEKTRSDIWTVDCGFPGVETQMPLMLSALAEHEATICDYVRWSAWNPARSWGLAPHKGAVQVGADADLALVDLNRTMRIDDHALHSRSKISPWNCREVTGAPRPYAGPRTVRDAGSRPGGRHAGLGQFGAWHPDHAAGRAERERDHGGHRATTPSVDVAILSGTHLGRRIP